MSVSQGAASGLPGMTLKAWGRVSSTGVLLKSQGVASVTLSSVTYSVTLNDAPGPTATVNWLTMAASLSGSVQFAADVLNISFMGSSGYLQTDFYFEVYA